MPELVVLNHASYGLAPHDMLEHCAAVRWQLEADPNVLLGEVLQDRLTSTHSPGHSTVSWPGTDPPAESPPSVRHQRPV
jgi:hypothetical protein